MVAALLPVAFLALAGQAPDAASPAPEADAGKPCPADDRRREREAAAREKDLAREAKEAAERTLREADAIARTHRDEARRSWIDAARERLLADVRARSGRGDLVRDHVSESACRALAARDAGAARSLVLPEETSLATAWLALREVAKQGPTGCASLAEELRPACVAVFAGSDHPCAGAPEPARPFCLQAARGVAAVETSCAEPVRTTACVWGRLVAAAARGRDPAPPAAAGASARRLEADALVAAVLAGTPDACPPGGAGPFTNLQSAAEAVLLEAPEARTALAVLVTDTPAACWLRWSPDLPGRALLVRSFEPAVVEVPVGAPAGAATAPLRAAAVCAPALVW